MSGLLISSLGETPPKQLKMNTNTATNFSLKDQFCTMLITFNNKINGVLECKC